jgi:hypothetical protein
MAPGQGNHSQGEGEKKRTSPGIHGVPPFEMLPSIVMETGPRAAGSLQLEGSPGFISLVENNG